MTHTHQDESEGKWTPIADLDEQPLIDAGILLPREEGAKMSDMLRANWQGSTVQQDGKELDRTGEDVTVHVIDAKIMTVYVNTPKGRILGTLDDRDGFLMFEPYWEV